MGGCRLKVMGVGRTGVKKTYQIRSLICESSSPAAGVVGRRVVPLLVAAGHRVTAVERTPEKRAELERMGAAAVYVDLFASDSVRGAVARHDIVINLATSIPPSSHAFLPGAWRKNDRVRSRHARSAPAEVPPGVGANADRLVGRND